MFEAELPARRELEAHRPVVPAPAPPLALMKEEDVWLPQVERDDWLPEEDVEDIEADVAVVSWQMPWDGLS